MRIIGGIHGGRRLIVPRGFAARPTTDFAREALFNILDGCLNYAEIVALDLFSGSGAIALELASRGCMHVDCVEISAAYCRHIQTMAQALALPQVHSIRENALTYVSGCKRQYDLIFADPPYDMDSAATLPDIIFGSALLKPSGMLILEHSSRRSFECHSHFVQHRKYGSVNFTIFRETGGMQKK